MPGPKTDSDHQGGSSQSTAKKPPLVKRGNKSTPAKGGNKKSRKGKGQATADPLSHDGSDSEKSAATSRSHQSSASKRKRKERLMTNVCDFLRNRKIPVSGADPIARAFLAENGIQAKPIKNSVNAHGCSAAGRLNGALVMASHAASTLGPECMSLIITDVFPSPRTGKLLDHEFTEDEPFTVHVRGAIPWSGDLSINVAKTGQEHWPSKILSGLGISASSSDRDDFDDAAAFLGMQRHINNDEDLPPDALYMCDLYHSGPGRDPPTPEGVVALLRKYNCPVAYVQCKLFLDVIGGHVYDTAAGRRVEDCYTTVGDGSHMRVTFYSDADALTPSYEDHGTWNFFANAACHANGLRWYPVKIGGAIGANMLYRCVECTCGDCPEPEYPVGNVRWVTMPSSGIFKDVLNFALDACKIARPDDLILVDHAIAAANDVSHKVARGYVAQSVIQAVRGCIDKNMVYKAMVKRSHAQLLLRTMQIDTSMWALYAHRDTLGTRMARYRALGAFGETALSFASAPNLGRFWPGAFVAEYTPVFLFAFFAYLCKMWEPVAAFFGFVTAKARTTAIVQQAYYDGYVENIPAGVNALVDGSYLPGSVFTHVPQKLLASPGIDDRMTIVHNGQRVTLREMYRLVDHTPAANNDQAMLPVALMATHLYATAKTGAACLRAFTLRTMADKKAVPEDGAWAIRPRAILDAFFASVHIIQCEKPEEYGTRMFKAGRWAKGKLKGFLQAVINNDHGIPPKMDLATMMKQEMLPIRFSEEPGSLDERYVKDRVVNVVAAQINSILAGVVAASVTAVKVAYPPDGSGSFQIGGVTFHCVYAAGMNQAMLNELGRTLVSGLGPNTCILAFCGDDIACSFQLDGLDGDKFLEFDAGAFDSHHSEELVDAMYPTYLKLWGPTGADIWRATMGAIATYKKPPHRHADTNAYRMAKGSANPSGVQSTTFHNCNVSMVILVDVIIGIFQQLELGVRFGDDDALGEAITAGYKRLGFAGTYQIHSSLIGMTFLRGWWFPNTAEDGHDQWVWIPLPSAALKLGKTMRPGAYLTIMASISGGYSGIPEAYPFLGPLLGHYRRHSATGTAGHLLKHVESAAYKTFVKAPFTVDMDQVIEAVDIRYSTNVHDRQQCVDDFADAPVPCVIRRDYCDKLWAADYA